MSESRWIVIDRWDDFQHPDVLRSKAGPAWIRTYTGLLAKDEFLSLSHHLRGVLLSLWLEYARAHRQLSDNTAALSRRLGQRVMRRDLEALNHAGFIRFSASKPASRTQADLQAQIRKESKERAREEKDKTPNGSKPNPFACPECGQTYGSDHQLAEHLEHVHWITPLAEASSTLHHKPTREASP